MPPVAPLNIKPIAVIVGIVVAIAAVLFAVNLKQEGETLQGLILGEPGSDNAIMTLSVYVRGEAVDFSKGKYENENPLVWFEPAKNDPTFINIRKKASGVTLPYFFEALGLRLTTSCVTAADGFNFCDDGVNKLFVFVNRENITNQVAAYELRQGDKILVNYGSEDEETIAEKINAIP